MFGLKDQDARTRADEAHDQIATVIEAVNANAAALETVRTEITQAGTPVELAKRVDRLVELTGEIAGALEKLKVRVYDHVHNYAQRSYQQVDGARVYSLRCTDCGHTINLSGLSA